MNKLRKKKRKKIKPFELKKINEQSIDRLILVGISIGVVIVVLLLRMLYLTIIKGSELAEEAETEWKSEMNLTAMRGNIVDRNGSILVTSTNVYRIEVDMDTLRAYVDDEKTTIEKVSANIAEAIGTSYDNIYKKLSDKENKFIKVIIYPKIVNRFSIFELVICDKKPNIDIEIKENVDYNKEIMTKFSIQKYTDMFYQIKDVVNFEENSFYIIKTNEYKNWHPAMANIDLDTIIEELLSENGGDC